ncbi:MAG TPA: beta-phosphoglucomutase [Flavobacteriaceae bacterium]|nr:beta-phosphoglucomutase [Flavobacteriaceae bacterium]
MNKHKAIIFDLDGVIVDTAKFHFLAWKKLANELGFDFSEEQNEAMKGLSRVHSFQKLLEFGNKEVSNADFERHLYNKNQDYLQRISTMAENDLLPGVKKVLDFLIENQIPFALGSASKNARLILKSLKIENQFAAIVDGTDVQKAKPDPEVFLTASEKLKKSPAECIVFEDSVAGIEAANSAGMTSIGIGDATILKEADYNFLDFTEIEIGCLEKLVLKK